MTPEAQEAIVEVFRLLERLGGTAPSNGSVFRIVRDDLGYRFMDREGKSLLAKFRGKARPGGAPEPPLGRPASAPEIEHERPGGAPEPPLGRPASAGATRAGDKVFLVPNPDSKETTSPSEGTRVRLPLDRDETIAARAILAAVWLVLEPSIGRSLTKTDWSRRNMNAARSLVRLGHSPQAVVDGWRAASATFREPVRMLAKVQDHMAAIQARAQRPAAPVALTPTGERTTRGFLDNVV